MSTNMSAFVFLYFGAKICTLNSCILSPDENEVRYYSGI